MLKKVINSIEEDLTVNNMIEANNVRKLLQEKKVFLLNVMSSKGSGKTTTLAQVLLRLKHNLRVLVLESDIDSKMDTKHIHDMTGVEVVQITNSDIEYVDAGVIKNTLSKLNLDNLDLILLENVGNLVSCAQYDTGAQKNVAILSVQEGDDKPTKYPLMYKVADVVLINKMDVANFFDFDLEKCKAAIYEQNPNAKVICACAKNGDGIEEFCSWILAETRNYLN